MTRVKMVNRLTVFGLLAINVVFLSQSPHATADEVRVQQIESAPHLSIESNLREVTATSSGQTIEQVFTLLNTGAKPLALEIERTSCGCVGAMLSSKAIAPGQKATLSFKMQAGGWGGKSESVVLKTNDPRQPHATLTVQVKMPPTVVPNPAQLMIETTEGGTEKRYLTLLLPEGASLEFVDAQKPFISAQILESTPVIGGSAQRIAVSIAASAPPGVFKDEITFDLKNAPVPKIGVSIEGIVKDDIQIEPSRIFFGQIMAGSTRRKTFLVKSHSGKAFRIQTVKTSSPYLTVQASTMVNAASHAIEVAVQVEGKIGLVLQETIRLTLSSGRVLEVPIVGMVSADDASISVTNPLKPGSSAPNFTATDVNGNKLQLADFRYKNNLLLTFFPKCFTGGCAGQLASLQRELPNFTRHETEVWAVSVDSLEDQRAFAASLGLQFPLIPDVDRKLSMLYNAAQDKTDLATRMSVLIDKAGVVRWVDNNINVHTHGADILAKMRELGMAQ